MFANFAQLLNFGCRVLYKVSMWFPVWRQEKPNRGVNLPDGRGQQPEVPTRAIDCRKDVEKIYEREVRLKI